ncbi:Uncharacterized protein FWK35_00038907 [Aphis craccivora]|uniref:Uncharacterized protein n=1 Tax=Aphis craccivora TaxID=307492 RepID=A0A6G0VUU1_APHCR|nr:Uncharacterized protein FWK35_00038907 [Aphis craccivora]
MGSSNVGLWRNLDISITNTSFKHPIIRKMYMCLLMCPIS